MLSRENRFADAEVALNEAIQEFPNESMLYKIQLDAGY
jgi:hypothetical protein